MATSTQAQRGRHEPDAARRAGTPRLKLEEPEVAAGGDLAVAAQDSAMANAVPVTRAAQEVSAAEQRVVALERNLQDMRVDATAHRAAMDQMRSRLGQADERNQKVWTLSAVAIGLAAVALWQGLRLRNLRRERPAGRWQGVRSPRPKWKHCRRMRPSWVCPWSIHRYGPALARRAPSPWMP